MIKSFMISELKNKVANIGSGMTGISSKIGTAADTSASTTLFGKMAGIVNDVSGINAKLSTMDGKLDSIMTNTNWLGTLTDAQINKLKTILNS